MDMSVPHSFPNYQCLRILAWFRFRRPLFEPNTLFTLFKSGRSNGNCFMVVLSLSHRTTTDANDSPGPVSFKRGRFLSPAVFCGYAPSVGQAIKISAVFTVASLLRSYTLRRAFNRGAGA